MEAFFHAFFCFCFSQGNDYFRKIIRKLTIPNLADEQGNRSASDALYYNTIMLCVKL